MTTDRNCLDAETVAAWMDGGLDPAAQAAAEAHASTCERCQALLATVARTMPADAVAEPMGSRLWKWWLAPLAATAAAVTIWMVVPQKLMQPERQDTPITEMAAEAEKPQPPPAARDQVAPAARVQTQPPAEPAAPPQRSLADARRNAPAPADADKAKDQNAFAREVDKPDAVGSLRADAQGARREEAPRATEMRQAAETPKISAAPAPPAAPAPAAEAPAERFREAAPVAPAASGARAMGQLRKQSTPPVIVSPDPNSRWRAAPGTIERSEDGGRVWIPVRLAGNEEVLAGASPARLVCWLVGRGGLVLLATDGTNFTRLPFPVAVDLVSVSSPEPRIAVVTAADGRTFRTENGGRNWRNP